MKPKEIKSSPDKDQSLNNHRRIKIRRLHQFRSRLPTFSDAWWVVASEVITMIVLFLINFWLLFPFFGREDRTNVFSAPVIPVLAGLTEGLTPFAYSLRLWLLIFLVFFPLSYYYFAREISGRRLVALLATAIAILPTGIFLTFRVKLGLLSQDGGHVASLTMTPLICLLLLRFLRAGNFWWGVLSASGTTLVALTSPLGLVVLLAFMAVMTFSEMLLGSGRLKLIRLALVLVLAAGFSAFWYNPKFILLTWQSPQGQLLKKTFTNLLPVSFFILPLLGIFGFLLFENRSQLQSMFIAFFLTICFAVFSLGTGVAATNPSRFLAALGISLSLLVGIILVNLFDFLRFSPGVKRFGKIVNYRNWLATGLILGCFLLLLLVTGFSREKFWQLENTRVLGLSSEQKVGIWEIKEDVDGLETVAGYTITALTGATVMILKIVLGV